ncbi:hypothetical protein AB0C33_45050 [Nonomuraea sp. NPDC048881]|uniref:hypothetical protein n=1 Tax=Nonomuraea sp. NPDC048881 TaxID=3155030 RepID=UPI003400850D
MTATDTRGNLLRISAARPGRASETTTARHHNLVQKLRQADPGALADLGFVGLYDDPDDPIIITGLAQTGEAAQRVGDGGARARRLTSHLMARLSRQLGEVQDDGLGTCCGFVDQGILSGAGPAASRSPITISRAVADRVS